MANSHSPLSALIWWFIPLFGVIGSIGYVVWVSKFQKKYENETHRSVSNFQRFQASFAAGRKQSSLESEPRDRGEATPTTEVRS